MTLLIHSMAEFGDIITGAMDLAGVRDVVEIGAEYGGMTTTLADRCRDWDGGLTSIDPAPKPQFETWLATRPDVRHVRALSLDAIGHVDAPDAWVIDGDHNWYTVYHELVAAEAVARAVGTPFFAFLHDVDWPCGRRDFYYAPERIPAAFRHPYDYDGGVLPGQGAPMPGRGFRGMGQFAVATHEGGPRNGVLTAVEDFLAEAAAAGRAYAYAQVPAVFGLGIIIPADAPWCEAVAQFLLPYHDNALIRSLERNRLANYLTVLDWQDRLAA